MFYHSICIYYKGYTESSCPPWFVSPRTIFVSFSLYLSDIYSNFFVTFRFVRTQTEAKENYYFYTITSLKFIKKSGRVLVKEANSFVFLSIFPSSLFAEVGLYALLRVASCSLPSLTQSTCALPSIAYSTQNKKIFKIVILSFSAQKSFQIFPFVRTRTEAEENKSPVGNFDTLHKYN